MLLSKAIEGFLIVRQGDGLSPTTARIYGWALGKLVLFMNDPEVASIKTEDLRKWFVWLRTEYKPGGPRAPEHLSLGSIKNAWRAMKAFYRWAAEDLGVPRVDTIKSPQGEEAPVIPYSEEEIRGMIRSAQYTIVKNPNRKAPYKQRRPFAARNLALLMTLLDTGMRASELARLKVGDLDIKTGEIHITRFGTGRKTKDRYVFLGRGARRAMWKYLAERTPRPEEPLFLGEAGHALNKGAVLYIVRRIGEQAGISKAHPHKFRHTFAVQFLKNGGNVFVLQQLLGHSDLTMSRRYIYLAKEDAAVAMEAASPVDRWGL